MRSCVSCFDATEQKKGFATTPAKCYKNVTKSLRHVKVTTGIIMVNMNTSTLHSYKIIRLLTFVCFFNFSGLNNGYTYMTAVSPLKPAHSFSAVGASVLGITNFFRADRIIASIYSGRRIVVAMTLKLEDFFKYPVIQKRGPKTLRETQNRVVSPARNSKYFTPQVLEPAGKQGIYLKEQKETWVKSEKLEVMKDPTVSYFSAETIPFGSILNLRVKRRLDRDPDVIRRIQTPRIQYSSEDDPINELTQGKLL